MDNSEEVKKQFDQFFAHHTSASKGRVYVLDLAPVQERIGERWDRLLNQVHATTNDVVRHRLAPSDLFCKWEDTKFLIAFGELDQARAKIKVSLIAQEISQRLLGSADQDISVKVSMADTDEQGHFLWDQKVDPAKDITDTETDTSKAPRVKPKSIQKGLVSENVEFIFRPLWFVKNKIISAYFCIPVRDRGDGGFVSGYNVLDDPYNPQAIEALDLMTMIRIHNEVLFLQEQNNPALITVPIHFESLAAKGRLSTLLELCKKNLAQYRQRIVVEITNLPEGIPQSRLQGFVQALKPFSRAVMARFKINHRDFAGYKNIGLYAVGVDLYDDKRPEEKIVRDLETFAAGAAKYGLHSYVHGIRSISLNTYSICAGFEYVDGYAISEVGEGAQDVKYYSIRQPYDQKYAKDNGGNDV